MARLEDPEFREFLEELRSHFGTGTLQSRLTRTNVLVSGKSLSRPDAMSRQLYQLTIGLERDSLATRVLLSMWEELLASRIEKETGARLETIADRINECLDERLEIDPEKEAELKKALDEYQHELRQVGFGPRTVRLTMLTRAVSSVAQRLRQEGSREEGSWPS